MSIDINVKRNMRYYNSAMGNKAAEYLADLHPEED